MKKLKTIFLFEALEMFKKKAIIISTAIIALVLFSVTFIPRFLPTESSTPQNQTELLSGTIIIAKDSNTLNTMQNIFHDYEGIHYTNSEEEALDALHEETYERAFLLIDHTTYEYIITNQMETGKQEIFEAVYGHYLKVERLNELGVDVDAVLNAQVIQLDSNTRLLGKDSVQGIFFAFAMLFALYMLIILYGQNVATSVAREKDSRTMELLITSTKPKALIIGKVLAAGMVGIIQLITMIVALWIGFLINQSTYPDFIFYFIETSIKWDVILVYSVFSLLGYLLYLFIYAALGSLVSKVEDVASSITPVTFLFIAAYMIASLGMNAPDSLILRVSSYIPFVSLFTTPIRYMMTDVAAIELISSIALMIVATLLIMQLSIIIYRQGSLNYGNKMSLTSVLRGLIKKSK